MGRRRTPPESEGLRSMTLHDHHTHENQGSEDAHAHAHGHQASAAGEALVDPVCGMTVTEASPHRPPRSPPLSGRPPRRPRLYGSGDALLSATRCRWRGGPTGTHAPGPSSPSQLSVGFLLRCSPSSVARTSFSPFGSVFPAAPSLHQLLRALVRWLHRYYARLRLRRAHPTSFRCLHSAVPRGEHLVSLSRLALLAADREPGVGFGTPARTSRGDSSVSQVPGGPVVRVPRSMTPVRPTTSRHSSPSMWPSVSGTTSARTMSSISGLHHAAHGLAVYASRRRLPDTRARLASGWLPTLAGRGSYPQGPNGASIVW